VNSGAIWPPGRIAAAKSIDYGHKSLEQLARQSTLIANRKTIFLASFHSFDSLAPFTQRRNVYAAIPAAGLAKPSFSQALTEAFGRQSGLGYPQNRQKPEWTTPPGTCCARIHSSLDRR
jgi:hypothetical protein